MNKKRLAYLIIILIGVLLYGMSAFFGFSYFDDQSLIIDNQAIIKDTSNIGKIFVEDAFFSNQNFYYRPLLNISLMFDAQFAGINAWAYHLSNIAIHILVVLLLFSVLMKLKVSFKRSFFLSLFFLVHPALVQAVAWIPGRNDTLLAVFILASFLFFLRYLKENKIINYVACLLFFLLALFTKEAAVLFPFLLIFYYLFLSPKKIKASDKGLFVAGGAVVIFFWFIFRSLAIDGNLGSISSLFLSVVENSPALIVNIGKFFFPFNLAIMPVLKDVNLIFGLGAVGVISFLAFSKRINKVWLAFGLLWFILFMLPSFVNPNPAEFYYLLLLEHRLYLPFIGIIFIFKDLQVPYFNNVNRVVRDKVLMLISVVILASFSFLTICHLPNFKDNISFWSFAVLKSPNSPMTHRNLGAMLYFDGQLEKAEKQYNQALDLNPLEPMAHNNLGVIYRDYGNFDMAEDEFLAELELKHSSSYYLAQDNLDYLLILKNKLR
ncbi:MAG TPA: tetratricopeptide repeat protein [Patescibacteria group bacterium]|nr:tetratricopeptide repeat protein [Patescibacteria group bacterium]